jgi:hypothetical protein
MPGPALQKGEAYCEVCWRIVIDEPGNGVLVCSEQCEGTLISTVRRRISKPRTSRPSES